MRFGEFLEEIYRERKKTNERYSYRSMARQMGISPSFFTQVKDGQRFPKQSMAEKMARNLRLEPQQRKMLFLLLQLERSTEAGARRQITQEIKTVKRVNQPARSLKQDQFALICRWEHAAILELGRTEDFQPKATWLAARLGLDLERIESALKRLQRLGLLDDNLTPTHAEVRVADVPSAAIREFHKQHLFHAIEVLQSQSSDERDITGVTLAFRDEQLPALKQRIREFRREVMALCEGREDPNSKPTRVFHLGVQLFPLDNKKKNDGA